MVPIDSPSPDPVPPKRFGIKGRTQALYIVIPLILINAGILHTLVHQVAIKASAETTTQVKDESTTALAVDEVVPHNTPADAVATSDQPIITTYTVKGGDTLSEIAEKFKISVNTIRWANDLTSTSKINPGMELVILPVSGIEYTVKKGDTLSGIAHKFDVDQENILRYNDITADSIKMGTELVIPNAEPISAVQKAPAKKTPPAVSTPAAKTAKSTSTTSATTSTAKKAAFIMPIPGAILTQGIHDGNAVDFGAPVGTTVHAAASGIVLIAKSGGWNGGYGTYIVITHSNGTQTLYGHLSKISVAVGAKVTQGQKIGLSGNTGESTGPHLHYKEIGTGKTNTFAKFKVGTHF